MHKVQLTERDLSLLVFLWRWKVLSTAALTEKFYQGRSPSTAYTRLWHLRKAGYLQLQPYSEATSFVWSIAPKGFAAIQNYLPELAESGFRSENVGHDHMVSAVHLGEWLDAAPAGTESFTEQELRRYCLDHYPDWVPKVSDHRPDGYWRVPRNGKLLTIALEVEVSRKRDRFYQQLAHFYERQPEVHRIIWVVTGRAFAELVARLLAKEVGEKSMIHDFIVWKDFEKFGWNAPILIGAERNKPLSFLLDPSLQTSPKPVWTTFLVDKRKCPHRSRTYRDPRRAPFPDRVGGPHFSVERSPLES